ncbi:MAG TPA: DMT family transporter [Candidatus Acidoferrales bacterium]|nr:DMT family transporter [Candidatus Acidoferrales bacterium]
MTESLILGLTAAISWGVADFLARFAARQIGAYRSQFFMQAFGFGMLSAFWLASAPAGPAPVPGTAWSWAALAGALSASGSYALYRAFETGILAVVAPISAAYPALTVLLSIESGEKIHLARWAGIALVLAGVALAVSSTTESGPPASADARRVANGAVGWAIAAALAFGVMFWLLGYRVVPALGGVASVWGLRLVGVVGMGAAALPLRQTLRLPGARTLWLLMAMGLLDTAAYLANNFGMQLGHVAVVTVAVSVYAAVTVFLAAAVLREKLTGGQWLGVGLIFAGIVALAL